MESAWPASNEQSATNSRFLNKCINSEKDVIDFRTKSPAYRDILTYVNLLCDKIHSTSNKVLNKRYTIKDERFQKCAQLIDELSSLCDATDLSQAEGSAPLRFGHVAFRGWFDAARDKCRQFITTQLAPGQSNELQDELLGYLSDSFGNRMRIDYGTGHELNFIIFTMGLSNLFNDAPGHQQTETDSKAGHPLEGYVKHHGWDILALFAHKYLRLCRNFQTKFRLEPAGSRGVYNMDDFQYVPFLFGAAQLSGVKYAPSKEFYLQDHVDAFKGDFMFFEAVDYILNNKRGPFNEHSYTLWCIADLGSWENIYRRIKSKFTNDVLGPFPIVQHLLFGKHVLKWHE